MLDPAPGRLDYQLHDAAPPPHNAPAAAIPKADALPALKPDPWLQTQPSLQAQVPYTEYPILRHSEWQSKELDTYLLLLCEDGTHGLDLSFVTHLFLVHRIGDPALISQVVSRAHRMGCDPNHGVTVQTLHLFEDAVS